MNGRCLALITTLLFLSACTTTGYGSKPYPGKYPTKYPTDQPATQSAPPPVTKAPSTQQQPVPQPKPSAPANSDIRPGDSEVAMGAASAVNELLDEAWEYHDNGEYERALAVAERALRVDRRNAEVYLVMADSNYQLYRNDRARQLASQGLNYAERGSSTYRRLQDLLSRL